ncbi:MAG: hypothetical protein R3E35_11830 [Rhodocyclaceae bacterium]
MKILIATALALNLCAAYGQELERASPQCDADLQEQARQGADRGDPRQIYLMARYLSTGKCMPGDGKQAVHLYLKAASLGYAPARYNLGIVAAGNQDFTSAEGHFFEGARLGHRGCELQLGILYSLVPPPVGDDRKAYAWLLLTASRHEPISREASELLAKVRARISDQARVQAETLSAKLSADFGKITPFAQ